MTREAISQAAGPAGPARPAPAGDGLGRAVAARRDCALEWWFVQGVYAPRNQPDGQRHFMAGLFRHRLEAPGAPPVRGTSLLLSVLDPVRGAQRVASRVDPALPGFFIDHPGVLRKFAVDRRAIDVFLDMLAKEGPPRPLRVETLPAVIADDPPAARWGDFSFRAADGSLELSFREPGTGAPAAFVLRPERPAADIGTGRLGSRTGRLVGGITYPRSILTGSVRGRPVEGHAWLDHQWGDNVWFMSGRGANRPVRWDWLGLNLDDGSDWIVSVARDARRGRSLGRRLIVLDADGSRRDIQRFSLQPLREWESPRTGIRHPVEWRLRVPSLRADLVFTPFADDQEIPVFGIMRAIWEGAGRVSGKVDGRAVAGRARGEFQGYGCVFDFRETWRAAADRVDRRLREFFPRALAAADVSAFLGEPAGDDEPALFTRTLSEPAWELLRRGGKRWRPILALHLLGALDCDSTPYEGLIAALVELPHTGSLIVDDIQDRSTTRRGEPCVHLLFGDGPAINAANTLYFLPQIMLEDHPHLTEAQKLEIHRLLARQFVRAHFGQARDLDVSGSASPDALAALLRGDAAAGLLRMYRQKTAAPVAGLAELAAVISGAPPGVRETCTGFGRALGTAFQIVDDLRDFGSGPDRGKDLAEGKITYVIVRALERLQGPPRDELVRILTSPSLRADPAARERGIGLVRGSGALAACHDEAGAMVAPHWAALSALLGPSEHKMILRLLVLHLIDFAAGLEPGGARRGARE